MNKISKIIWSLFSGAVCLVYKSENVSAHNIPVNNQCTIYSGTSICGDPNSTSNPVPNIYYNQAYNCNGNSTVYCIHTIAGHTIAARQCTSCKTPYTFLKGDILGDTSCSSRSLYEYTCECVCSNCTASGSWSAYGTGYERYTGQGCDCSGSTATCKTITDYRCAKGYYGKTTNGTTGCTQCVSPATTRSAGSEDISSCYIPEGTYSDTTGKYAMNCDCPYAGRDNCGSGSSSSSA